MIERKSKPHGEYNQSLSRAKPQEVGNLASEGEPDGPELFNRHRQEPGPIAFDEKGVGRFNLGFMKTKGILAMLVFGALAFEINAQYVGTLPEDGPGLGRPGLGRNGPHPPQSALMQALDVNHDGVIDAHEIANASVALRTLDKNGDGRLTPDELRSARFPDSKDPTASTLMQALDANHDGVIDAHEIANAPVALRKLDRNRDGKLTPDELQPVRSPQGDDLDASYVPSGGLPDPVSIEHLKPFEVTLERIYPSDDLLTWDDRDLRVGQFALDDIEIRADAAGGHLYPGLAEPRFGIVETGPLTQSPKGH